MKKELVLVMKSFYDAIVEYLNANGYTVAVPASSAAKDDVVILHAYPADKDTIHIPSVSIEHIIVEDDEGEEMGFYDTDYDMEMGVFTKNFFERDQLISTIRDFLRKSIALIDYNAVTPTEYNRIRFEDISHRSVISITEQEERKYAGEIFFTAVVVNSE